MSDIRDVINNSLKLTEIMELQIKDSRKLKDKIQQLEAQLAEAVETLEIIQRIDMKPTPCPDNKPGCLVAHFTLGESGKIAKEFLTKVKGSKK